MKKILIVSLSFLALGCTKQGFDNTKGMAGPVDFSDRVQTLASSSSAMKAGEIVANEYKQFLIGYVFDADSGQPIANALVNFSDTSDPGHVLGSGIDCGTFKLNGRSTFTSLDDLRANVEKGPGAFCTSIDQSSISYGFGPCLPCILKGNLWLGLAVVTDDNGRFQLDTTSIGIPYFAFAQKRGFGNAETQSSNLGMASFGKNIGGSGAAGYAIIPTIFMRRR